MVQSFGRNFLRASFAAEGVDHPGRHVVDRNIGGGRGAALRQFLEDERGVEPRQRRAADIFLHIDAAEAERRGLAQRFDRENLVFVPVARMRHHFVARECRAVGLEGALVFGEVEIHVRPREVNAPANATAYFAEVPVKHRLQPVAALPQRLKDPTETDHGDQIGRPLKPASASCRPRQDPRSRPALDLAHGCAATGAPNGRAGWYARTCSRTDDLIWPLFVMEGNKPAAR